MKKDYIEKYHFNNKGWIWGTIWPALLYLGLSFFIGIIGAIIAAIYASIKGIDYMDIAYSGNLNLFLNIIVQIISLSIYLPIYLINKKKYYPKPKQKPNIKIILLSICFVFLILTPTDMLLTYISNHFDISSSYYELTQELITDASPIISIITVILLGPITEELMIRGLSLNKALSRKKVITAIIISSIIFGIIHLNLLQGIFAFIVGITLAIVFIKTKSIIPCIIIHIINNLIAYITMYTTNNTTLIINIITIVISIIPAILFIKEKEIEYE